jgi:hypothetical protein
MMALRLLHFCWFLQEIVEYRSHRQIGKLSLRSGSRARLAVGGGGVEGPATTRNASCSIVSNLPRTILRDATCGTMRFPVRGCPMSRKDVGQCGSG